MKINGHIEVPDKAIADFCKKWRISEVALFGSVLREDFRPDSDIDVLVRFQRPIPWGLFDIIHMEDELAEIIGRKVHTVDRLTVEESKNYIWRKSVLESARSVYSA